MQPVSNSAYFRMSKVDGAAAPLDLALDRRQALGLLLLAARGDLLHGSLCFLTIATPPVVPSARACSKRSSAVRSLP